MVNLCLTKCSVLHTASLLVNTQCDRLRIHPSSQVHCKRIPTPHVEPALLSWPCVIYLPSIQSFSVCMPAWYTGWCHPKESQQKCSTLSVVSGHVISFTGQLSRGTAACGIGMQMQMPYQLHPQEWVVVVFCPRTRGRDSGNRRVFLPIIAIYHIARYSSRGFSYYVQSLYQSSFRLSLSLSPFLFFRLALRILIHRTLLWETHISLSINIPSKSKAPYYCAAGNGVFLLKAPPPSGPTATDRTVHNVMYFRASRSMG